MILRSSGGRQYPPSDSNWRRASGAARWIGEALGRLDAPERAVVAVGVEELAATAIQLIEAGTRRVLVEKPGGLNTSQIRELRRVAVGHGAEVRIAYNRRFYASVNAARRMIADDGGATSCSFEFTEWSHVIAP
jgi:predicted dehydrogenase